MADLGIESEFAEQVAVDDPRFKRPYDDSDGRMQDYKRTIWGWQDKDDDRRLDYGMRFDR